MPRDVFIGLGSNLGDRLKALTTAAKQLAPDVRVLKASKVYETPPWGYEDQPAFLNQVLQVETELDPPALLEFLKRIEKGMGRKPTFRYGPRAIDLDILFYDDLIYSSVELQIPHPLASERAFVLIPMREIASEFMHPALGKTISELARNVDSGGIKFYEQSTGEIPEIARRKKTRVMGIINLTPDSFSGDGVMASGDPLQQALAQAEEFIRDGADILDLGAESSRPGAQPVAAEEELKRLLPVLREIKSHGLKAIISIDTWKPEVAEACLEAGADWINDIWALRADARLAQIVARHQAAVVLMHNHSRSGAVRDLGALGSSYSGAEYKDLIPEIMAELKASIRTAREAGIADEHIIIDPGIGFGKTVSQNLALINNLDKFKPLGYPLLIGPSRKSFIGQVLDLPVEEREEGTAAAVAIGIARGADIIRVHNVKLMARVAKMADAIIKAKL